MSYTDSFRSVVLAALLAGCVPAATGPASPTDTGSAPTGSTPSDAAVRLGDPWSGGEPGLEFGVSLEVWNGTYVFGLGYTNDLYEEESGVNPNVTAFGQTQFNMPDALDVAPLGFGSSVTGLGDVTGDFKIDLAISYRDLGRIELAPRMVADPNDTDEVDLDWYPHHVTTPSGGGDQVAHCGDLDGDRRDDLCTTAGVWFGPVGQDPAADVAWAPADAIASGDLLGDGVADLIVATGSDVHQLVGAMTGRTGLVAGDYASASVTADGPVTALATGDFDGDGVPEVAIGTDQGTVVGAWDASGVWTEIASLPGPVWDLAVGDYDGDGVSDLAVGGAQQVAWYAGPVDGRAPVRTFTYAGYAFFGRSLAAGDTDGDGVSELLIGAPDPDWEAPSAIWFVTAP